MNNTAPSTPPSSNMPSSSTNATTTDNVSSGSSTDLAPRPTATKPVDSRPPVFACGAPVAAFSTP
jgi:hypothetical protein